MSRQTASAYSTVFSDMALLDTVITRATTVLQSHQTPDGYWWYTLEANETIGAESTFLWHALDLDVPGMSQRIAARILSEQRDDGSWSLTFGGPGDLSTTVECYLACRMAGHPATEPPLLAAKHFIRHHGGLDAARVFTKIHLATLGLGEWRDCPVMPAELILLPARAPFSVYSFSSWARACIIPLLIVMAKRPVWPVDIPLRHELSATERPTTKRDAIFDPWGDFFRGIDRFLKLTRPFAQHRPTKSLALRRAEQWIRDHIAETEDIFPALAYGALALRALGCPTTDDTIVKAVAALRRFQHSYAGPLPPLPFTMGTGGQSPVTGKAPMHWQYAVTRVYEHDPLLHQQCCISPVWDTPWALCALRAAGVVATDPGCVRAGTWLLTQQIATTSGDWRFKNPEGQPGGWAFEFENTYFPDVDDTIQVIMALQQVALPETEKKVAITRGLQWCLSMQNRDGGWGAFDKNNDFTLVNRIPFADHGACLDPATPDITGRMLELLAQQGFTQESREARRVVRFLRRHQRADGSWFGRWGVNFIYGTWCVLRGLRAIDMEPDNPLIERGADWLCGIQHADGGYGESVASYLTDRYVPAPHSVPSQTAWALMGLIAAHRASSEAAQAAAHYLLTTQDDDGVWEEREHTGTGFPGHFYIRYHGYRHYFPLLALAEWRTTLSK